MQGSMRYWANLGYHPTMVLEELKYMYKLHSVFGLQLQNRRDKLYTLSHFAWRNSTKLVVYKHRRRECPKTVRAASA
jgi:hypothetical protein